MIKIAMRTSVFVLTSLLAATTVGAAPPDGYLSGPAFGLAQPIGIGVSLPVSQVEDDEIEEPLPLREVPSDVRLEEIEQRLGAWLDRKLRNPEKIKVTCAHSGESWRAGHFDEIAVRLEGGKLDMVPVSTGTMRMTNVTIDLPRLFSDGEVVITSKAVAEAHLEVTQDGLNAVLEKKAKRLRVETPHIELADGQVQFTGRMKTLLIKNDVMTAGRFEISDGAKLNFFPTRLKVGYLPLPGAALSALARRFNPIVDLARLKPIRGITFQLERVTVVAGKLILETANGSRIAKL